MCFACVFTTNNGVHAIRKVLKLVGWAALLGKIEFDLYRVGTYV